MAVADEDWGGADDLIGSCAAPLSGLCDGEEHVFQVDTDRLPGDLLGSVWCFTGNFALVQR